MKATVRFPTAGLALGLMLGLTGCALPTAQQAMPAGPSAVGMRESVIVGRSTRDEVQAKLGKPVVVRFDSGYEVWVYRHAAPARSTKESDEFVILFAPSGVVERTRIRIVPQRVADR